MGQERLTGERVLAARKIIKNLGAVLRLALGALTDEARKVRNYPRKSKRFTARLAKRFRQWKDNRP